MEAATDLQIEISAQLDVRISLPFWEADLLPKTTDELAGV